MPPFNDQSAGRHVAPQNHLPTGSVAIRTHELTKRFDEALAVDQVTMSIPRGSIFGFIGPSGCGKTTTMRLLLGIYKATGGVVEVLGRSPDAFTTAERQRIGYMPQIFVMYPDLTVWENLNFAASLYGVPLRRYRRFQELLDLVELTGHAGKRARDISGDMRQRLSLAAALVHNPELLFLDEPTAGIDPVLRNKFWAHFHHLQSQGHTLFITTQYVGEAAHCDYVGVMADGRLLMVETPGDLRRRALGGHVIRIFAFVRKEIISVLRQPRPIFSLILGPFLILLLFGIGYREEARTLRTLFVMAEGSPMTSLVQDYSTRLGQQFASQGVLTDAAEADRLPRQQQVDLVIVVPPDPLADVRANRQAEFTLYHYETDPYEKTYIEILGCNYLGVPMLGNWWWWNYAIRS